MIDAIPQHRLADLLIDLDHMTAALGGLPGPTELR
jgi:hypothetical protein